MAVPACIAAPVLARELLVELAVPSRGNFKHRYAHHHGTCITVARWSVRHGRLDFVARMPRFSVQASTFPLPSGPNVKDVAILLP
jgi:hypothetical protein